MTGFTGIPGQTRAGAQAYADSLYEAYKQRRLALQYSRHEKAENFWSIGKKAAPGIWGEIRDSFDQKALDAARMWDRGAASNFWTWLALGNAIGYWSLTELSKIAPYLAKLGPESWGGAAFDLLSMGSGTLAIRAVKGLAGNVKGLKIAEDARKTRILETFLKESAEAGEIAIRGAGKGRQVKALGQWKNVPTPGGPLYHLGNTLDTVATAVKKHAPLLSNQYVRLGMVIAKKTLPEIAGQQPFGPAFPKQRTGPTLPEQRPGATRSRPFDWSSNAIPPAHLQTTFRPDRPGQPGWGLEVTRSRPFDWSSNAIPPAHLQTTFRPDRPGQPGWGLEVTRSRPSTPQPGSLRWMAQGLR